MTANTPIEISMPKVSATIATINMVDPALRRCVSMLTANRIVENDASLAMKDGKNKDHIKLPNTKKILKTTFTTNISTERAKKLYLDIP